MLYYYNCKKGQTMKFFILTLIGLVALFFLSSCGVIQTHSHDEQQVKFLEEYSGLYVFDKALRDEMRQIEEERKRKYDEFMDDWFKTHEFFTFKDDSPLLEKILPPKVLSNGCKYEISAGIIPILLLQKDEEKLVRLSGEKKRTFITKTDFTPYFEKIKEYMGEEAFNAYKGSLTLTARYYVDEDKVVPVSMYTRVYSITTTYGIYGDEGAGIRFSKKSSGGIASSNLFYIVDGKFVKSDEHRERSW